MAKKYRFFMKNGRELNFKTDYYRELLRQDLKDDDVMVFDTEQGNTVYIKASEVQSVFVYEEDDEQWI